MADNIAKKEVDDLKEDLSRLREDMGNLLTAVKNIGQSTARTARAKAEEGLDEVGDRLNRAYTSARETGGRAAESTRNEIENHPVASISIALVVGIVLGKLISLK
jgi:ElaB/YqjD/DUF883 family membrane-anchored ribosome-binding protein